MFFRKYPLTYLPLCMALTLLSGCLFKSPVRYIPLTQHDTPQLVFIHSISEYPILIDKYNITGPLQAGWTSQLRKANWSLLYYQAKEPFVLSCRESKLADQWKSVACEKVIEVKQLSAINTSRESSGNYWVAEDLAYETLLLRAHDRGFTWSKESKSIIKDLL